MDRKRGIMGDKEEAKTFLTRYAVEGFDPKRRVQVLRLPTSAFLAFEIRKHGVGFVIFPLELTGVPEVPVIPLKWREFDAEQFPIVYTDEECPTCISNPCMCLVLEGWHPTDKRKLNDDERARLEMRLMDANNKAQERSAKR